MDTSHRVDEVLTVIQSHARSQAAETAGRPATHHSKYVCPAECSSGWLNSTQLATQKRLTRGKKLTASLCISPIRKVSSQVISKMILLHYSWLILPVNYSGISVAASHVVTISMKITSAGVDSYSVAADRASLSIISHKFKNFHN